MKLIRWNLRLMMKMIRSRFWKHSAAKIVRKAQVENLQYPNRTSNGIMRMKSVTFPKERRLELLQVWGTAIPRQKELAATTFRINKSATNTLALFLHLVKATSRSSSYSSVSGVMASPINSSWKRRPPKNSQQLSIICSTYKMWILEFIGHLIWRNLKVNQLTAM